MGSSLRWIAWSWVTLPLTAVDWWFAWSQLPERVVMKFDADGRPIHWAARRDAMSFDLGVLGFVLLVVTAIAVFAALAQPDRARSVSMGGAACAAFVFLLLNAILWRVQVP